MCHVMRNCALLGSSRLKKDVALGTGVCPLRVGRDVDARSLAVDGDVHASLFAGRGDFAGGGAVGVAQDPFNGDWASPVFVDSCLSSFLLDHTVF
jgi:hypothetical protein